MSTFTKQELAICQVIGIGGAALGLLMLIGALIAGSRNVGVPEYIATLRGSGALAILVGLTFAGLATLRRVADY